VRKVQYAEARTNEAKTLIFAGVQDRRFRAQKFDWEQSAGSRGGKADSRSKLGCSLLSRSLASPPTREGGGNISVTGAG